MQLLADDVLSDDVAQASQPTRPDLFDVAERRHAGAVSSPARRMPMRAAAQLDGADSRSSASRASRAAASACTGMWPEATNWPPERRTARANGVAHTFS